MILTLYRDAMQENIFGVYDVMQDIQKYTEKKFTSAEAAAIIHCYWDEGMVDLADWLSDAQIDKLQKIE